MLLYGVAYEKIGTCILSVSICSVTWVWFWFCRPPKWWLLKPRVNIHWNLVNSILCRV